MHLCLEDISRCCLLNLAIQDLCRVSKELSPSASASASTPAWPVVEGVDDRKIVFTFRGVASARPIQGTSHVPSSRFRTVLVACSARSFAGLLHPATDPEIRRVSGSCRAPSRAPDHHHSPRRKHPSKPSPRYRPSFTLPRGKNLPSCRCRCLCRSGDLRFPAQFLKPCDFFYLSGGLASMRADFRAFGWYRVHFASRCFHRRGVCCFHGFLILQVLAPCSIGISRLRTLLAVTFRRVENGLPHHATCPSWRCEHRRGVDDRLPRRRVRVLDFSRRTVFTAVGYSRNPPRNHHRLSRAFYLALPSGRALSPEMTHEVRFPEKSTSSRTRAFQPLGSQGFLRGMRRSSRDHPHLAAFRSPTGYHGASRRRFGFDPPRIFTLSTSPSSRSPFVSTLHRPRAFQGF